MSERLNQVLASFGEQWDKIVEQLQTIIDELRSDSPEPHVGTPDIPEVYMPFLRTALEAYGADDDVDESKLRKIHAMTIKIVDHIRGEVHANRSIWSSFKMADQECLRSEVFEIIFDMGLGVFGVDQAEALADHLLQQAKANDDKLRAA